METRQVRISKDLYDKIAFASGQSGIPMSEHASHLIAIGMNEVSKHEIIKEIIERK